ncbi:hypothetical protein [Alkaliphilus crotonatoxidans]
MGYKEALCTFIALYYYGIDHLNINLKHLVQQETKNNKLILFFLGDDLKQSLNHHWMPEIHKNPELIMENPITYTVHARENAIENNVDRTLTDALNNGYSGVTWFIEAKQLIKETSKSSFLDWQRSMNLCFNDSKCSVINIFDFEDFLGHQKFIDQEIIDSSLKAHQYVIHQLKLKRSKYYIKEKSAKKSAT